jgi:HEAT repeat protein
LIDDETVAPHLRRRAIVALQWSPRPEASTRLGGIAADRARDEKLRGRALRCLAARDGVSALDLLIAALDDPSRRVRKDTLLALAELGVPGRPPLRAHLEREADAGLRDLVRRLLGPDVAPTAGSR